VSDHGAAAGTGPIVKTNWTGRDGRQAATRRWAGGGKGAGGARPAPDEGAGAIAA